MMQARCLPLKLPGNSFVFSSLLEGHRVSSCAAPADVTNRYSLGTMGLPLGRKTDLGAKRATGLIWRDSRKPQSGRSRPNST